MQRIVSFILQCNCKCVTIYVGSKEPDKKM